LSRVARVCRLPVGQGVYRLGEPAECLYVAFSGSVELVGRGEQGGECLVSTVLPDELFGDEALADVAVRQNDAYACSGTVVLEIPVGDLRRVVHSRSARWAQVRAFALSKQLQRVVRQFSLLGDLRAAEVRQWFGACEIAQHKAGGVVARKGEEGPCFYIVALGRLGVFDSPVPTESKRLRTLSRGDFFGELAILGGGVRTATVVAETDVALAVFSADALRRAFAESPEIERRIARAVSLYRGEVPRIESPRESARLARHGLPPQGIIARTEGRDDEMGAERNPGFWRAMSLLGRRLRGPLTTQRPTMMLGALFALLVSLAIQIMPLFSRAVMDTLAPPEGGTSQSVRGWQAIIAGYLLVILAQAGFGVAREFALNRLRTGMSRQFVGGVVARVFSLPLAFLRQTSVGGTMSVVSRAEGVQSALGETVISVAIDLLTLSVGLIWLFTIEPSLALKTVWVVPLLGLLSAWVVGPRLRRAEEELRSSEQAEKTMLGELLAGMPTLKTMGAEGWVHRRWSARYDRSLAAKAEMNLARIGPHTLSGLMTGLATCLLFLCAIRLTQSDGAPLSPGQFVEFLTRLMLVFQPVQSIMAVYPELQTFAGAVLAVDRLMSEPTELESNAASPVSLPDAPWSIRLENVAFAYQPGVPPAVNDVSFEAKPGQMIAIVGKSGCGKTTLVNLLLRFYTPQAGRILVNDTDIGHLPLGAYRAELGVVQQENHFFSESILDNLALARPDVSPDEARQAAIKAHAHDFIMGQPGTYDHRLQEGGFNLSGGERQRLAIARALLRRPRLLIFDEATSALDNESERMIQNNLRAMAQDCVTIVVAHRLSTIRHAHQILVMDSGRIVERGTHHQLLERAGLYAHLLQQSLS